MRAAGNLQLYSLILLFLSTFSAAWPWPRWLSNADALMVRQNDENSSSSGAADSAAPTQSSSNLNTDSSTNTGSATNTGSVTSTGSGSSTGSTSASGSSGSSGTASKTGSTTKGSGSSSQGSSTTASASQSTSYDPRLPAGGVSLLIPNIQSGSQFYKIGDYVTFAWNYTSLLATPTAIDVMATCVANQQLYTITMNQTVTNATGAVTWDTGAYQQTALSEPLLTEIYTLIIYDVASSISATAEAGRLAVYNQYAFGMYTPQPYTPLADFQCATCSGALSDLEKRALGVVFGMACITVLSFSWFVGGTGVIW